MKGKFYGIFIVAIVIISFGLTTKMDVSAKTLAQSFKSSIKYVYVSAPNSFSRKYQKQVCAQTVGYVNKKQLHHVVAYIGGSRKSTKGAVETKRSYGYRDISATAKNTQTIFLDWSSSTKSYSLPFGWKQTYFKTGYTKYGMGK